MNTAAKKKNSLASSVIASMFVLLSALLSTSAASASSVSQSLLASAPSIEPTLPTTASTHGVVGSKTRAEIFLGVSLKSIERSELNPANATRYYDALEGVALECLVAPIKGPGAFTTLVEEMSERAAAYQRRITGLGENVGYLVKGTKFDGFMNGVLIDAKGPGYAKFVRDGVFRSWYRGADGLVEQAQRQLVAAAGTPIRWHVAEEAAANAIRNLLRSRGITGIDVVFTP